MRVGPIRSGDMIRPNVGVDFPLVRPGGRRRTSAATGGPKRLHLRCIFDPLLYLVLMLSAGQGAAGAAGAEGVGSRMCGVPGQSERGGYLANLFPTSGVYGAGQRADYQCSKGFTLLGNASRLCQDDGLWSGSWPRCVDNLALERPVVASRLLPEFSAAVVVDGDVDTCVYFDMRVEDRFLQIDLGRNHMIQGLTIHVPLGYGQELAVFVAEKLQSSPGIQYRRCSNSLTSIRDQKRKQVDCVDEAGRRTAIPGRFIHIRDERKVRDFYFSVCEVEIYAAEESPSCGIPDQPAYGNRSRISSHLYEYSCQPGFLLDGARFTRCRDGLWQEPTPICIAVECQPLAGIDHGFVDLLPIRGLSNYSFNTVAHYRCADGYSIVGDSRRTCGPDAQWTGTQPVCRPVDCGPPHNVMNAVYQLSESGDANRSEPGTVAYYKCVAGYNPHRILPDKPIQTMSVCQRNGVWRDVHFYCAFQTTTAQLTTETPPPLVQTPSTVKEPQNAAISPVLSRPLQEVDFIQIASSSSSAVAPAPEQTSAGPSANVTAVAAIGVVAAFVVVLVVGTGVALNVCRMRTVFDGLKKRVSLTSTNQLIGDYPPGKGGCSCGQQLDSKAKKEQAAQVEIEPTADTEPVYNELDQPSDGDRSAPIADETTPQAAPICDQQTDFLDGDDVDEKFYLDIEDSRLATETSQCESPFRLDNSGESGDSSWAYTSSNPPSTNPSLTPDEILQLYARVDKSKKKRNRQAVHNQKSPDVNPAPTAEDGDVRSPTERQPRRKIIHSKKMLDDFHPNKVNDLHPRRVVAVSFHEINELNSASRLARGRDLRWPQHVCGRDGSVPFRAESRPLPPLPPQSQSDHPSSPVEDVHIYATLPTPS